MPAPVTDRVAQKREVVSPEARVNFRALVVPGAAAASDGASAVRTVTAATAAIAEEVRRRDDEDIHALVFAGWTKGAARRAPWLPSATPPSQGVHNATPINRRSHLWFVGCFLCSSWRFSST